MNKLSYGLLSLLATKPQTGYNLMLSLNRFWHTNHSAIYPLLSELEKKECVRFTLVGQQGKPDKKIYNITENGMTALKEWIVSPLENAVIKDEMVFKVFCMKILERDTVETLLNQIEGRYHEQLDRCEKHLVDIQSVVSTKSESADSITFGGYILLHKAIFDAQSGLKWCKWVRSLYEKKRGASS